VLTFFMAVYNSNLPLTCDGEGDEGGKGKGGGEKERGKERKGVWASGRGTTCKLRN